MLPITLFAFGILIYLPVLVAVFLVGVVASQFRATEARGRQIKRAATYSLAPAMVAAISVAGVGTALAVLGGLAVSPFTIDGRIESPWLAGAMGVTAILTFILSSLWILLGACAGWLIGWRTAGGASRDQAIIVDPVLRRVAWLFGLAPRRNGHSDRAA